MATATAHTVDRARPRAARRDEAVPCRRCIVTGEVRPKAELLRFVVGPDGAVVPDIEGRLPGRGLWLSPGRDMVEAARVRNLFAKAARRKLDVPADLADRVDGLLVRRCLDLLGLARRAGRSVAGYEKVAAWVASGRAALLFQAADGAEGGRRKLRAQARKADRSVPVIELFTAQELGRALGGDAWVHVAVAPGGAARRLAEETSRLSAFRGAPMADGARDGRSARP